MNPCYRNCCAQFVDCGPCCIPSAIDNWPASWRDLLFGAMRVQLCWPDEPTERSDRKEFHRWMYLRGSYADDGGPSAEQLVMLEAPGD